MMGQDISQMIQDKAQEAYKYVLWIWESFHRETTVLVLGLDNAGKTATLYALHLGEPMPFTVPTIGFNVESVKVGRLDIKMWDIGGQDRFPCFMAPLF